MYQDSAFSNKWLNSFLSFQFLLKQLLNFCSSSCLFKIKIIKSALKCKKSDISSFIIKKVAIFILYRMIIKIYCESLFM